MLKKPMGSGWRKNQPLFFYIANKVVLCYNNYNNISFYFLKNLQGDIIAILNSKAQTVARYSYDAWGVPTIEQDISDCGIASINPFRYRGYYFDQEIGMYYLQSRYYDPTVGRFVNGDEIAYCLVGFGQNGFCYCSNDIVMHADPWGFGPWTGSLNLWDYKKIHNKVADLIAWQICAFGAQREKYVRGSKGTGFLDVYDPYNNEYYEVKSIGSANLSSTKKQMAKYDVAKPLGSKRGCVKRGTKYVEGSFYYGAWNVCYYRYRAGLVVYTCNCDRYRLNKFRDCLAFAVVGAIVLITIAVVATGGAAAPAYGLLAI